MTDIVDAIQKRKALLDAAKQLRKVLPCSGRARERECFSDAEWLYSTFRVDCRARWARLISPSTADIKCTRTPPASWAKHCLNYIIPAAVDAVEIAEQRAGSTPPKRWPKLTCHRFGARCKVTARLRFHAQALELPRAFPLLARPRNGAVRRDADGNRRPRRCPGGVWSSATTGPGAARIGKRSRRRIRTRRS